MEYKPFGEVSILNDNVDWKHNYQGGRADETTGLISFRFRWYSPELGRWTQQDPIHFVAGDINIYRAIGNDPVNGLDPNGLQIMPPPQFHQSNHPRFLDEVQLGFDLLTNADHGISFQQLQMVTFIWEKYISTRLERLTMRYRNIRPEFEKWPKRAEIYNSYRYGYWVAFQLIRFGEKSTRIITNAHERGHDCVDSIVDVYNNELFRKLRDKFLNDVHRLSSKPSLFRFTS